MAYHVKNYVSFSIESSISNVNENGYFWKVVILLTKEKKIIFKKGSKGNQNQQRNHQVH